MKRESGIRFAIVAVLALGALAYFYVTSQTHFIVSRSELREAAPQMLTAYGHGEAPDCRSVRETMPFTYNAVCYLGVLGEQTVMFLDGPIDDYRSARGVFLLKDDAAEAPDGICTRHLFSGWWEFAPSDDAECPKGLGDYTGEA